MCVAQKAGIGLTFEVNEGKSHLTEINVIFFFENLWEICTYVISNVLKGIIGSRHLLDSIIQLTSSLFSHNQ